MSLPKKVIGWWFFLTGFAGGVLLGLLQMQRSLPEPYLGPDGIMWAYSIIYVSFLGVWFALFDYARGSE